jgi:oxygen-independent coproporphyrinogen-3 oxidase
MVETTPIGLYVHIPFCRARCTYCDFNTYTGLEHLHQPYGDALAQELSLLADRFPRSIGTLFVGGGTPTELPIQLLHQVLAVCFDTFPCADGIEVTCEANPGTVSLDYLQELRNLGVNRLSLGAQSFDDRELAMLGRIHTADQIGTTFDQARQSDFSNLSLDFIYGLPNQSLTTWAHTLEQALSLGAEHLSLYNLTLEDNTPLRDQVVWGTLPCPDPDRAADMYELASDRLAQAGYRQYEISNWSLPGYECQHNLVYWRNLPYLGAGAGAHSSSDGKRWWNVRPVQSYIDLIVAGTGRAWPSPAAEGGEVIHPQLEMAETMMLGLRLTQEGVAQTDFRRRFGLSLQEVYGDVMDELVAAELLAWDQVRLRLTARGRLLGNQVFFRFLPGQ